MNPALRKLYEIRSKYYWEFIRGHVGRQDSVVDIGAGSGFLAKQISERSPNITLMDVKDYNQTDLPLTLFDGTNLPAGDDEYDTAILCTVLHYHPDPERFLAEVKRVARKIIIVDEIYETKWDELLVNLNDGLVSLTVGIFQKFTFLRHEEHRRIFDALGLRVVADRGMRNFLRTTRQRLYVVER